MTAIVALSSVIPTASNSAVPVERGRERIRSGLIDQMKVVPEEDMPEVGPSVSAEVEVEVGKFDLGAASIEKEEYDAGVEEAFDQQDEIKPIDGQKIWGLPDLSEGAGEDIAPGIKAVSIDEVSRFFSPPSLPSAPCSPHMKLTPPDSHSMVFISDVCSSLISFNNITKRIHRVRFCFRGCMESEMDLTVPMGHWRGSLGEFFSVTHPLAVPYLAVPAQL